VFCRDGACDQVTELNSVSSYMRGRITQDKVRDMWWWPQGIKLTRVLLSTCCQTKQHVDSMVVEESTVIP
jgi:hypothetical protein